MVWTLDENKELKRHVVTIGISDGTSAELVSGDLNEGDLVVVGETATGTTRTGATQSAPGFGGAGGRPGGR